MLLVASLYLAALAVVSTTLALLPGLPRTRFWVGLPITAAVLAAGAWVLMSLLAPDTWAAAVVVAAAAATGLTKLWQRRWGWLSALLFATVTLATVAYLAYAAALTFTSGLGWLGTIGSSVLLVFEVAALGLAISYLFEILDRLGTASDRLPPPPDQLPHVALQVPAYNEPVEIVSETLRSLAELDYPRLMVQVVDNNTPDPEVWRPLEKLCRELGPRFQFIHLENWPGFKAGALNEAVRRLPEDVEVVGIVDADYLVEADWLRKTAGYFADPEVAFVQSPQDYRDWSDDEYLRGLYHSYKYFFDVSMPARAHRNAIIFAGTMGLIRLSALREIGGWDPEIITEDAEASLRMLARGHRGVYVNHAFGRGLMPLDFDGLKKQRYRWALGGVQILRRHAGLLLRGGGKLTVGQRVHYLLGSIQWFGELLMAVFTLLLLATAIATAMHHQLPIRRITGAALAVPLAFLVTGVLRAVWAIRATSKCGWRDAFNALRIWFALSWVVTLACIGGLVTKKPAFLRTPKRQQGQATLLRALRSSRTEAVLAAAAVLGTAAMLLRTPSWATVALGLLLLFQGFLYSNAVWASMAAEGITLTPTREAYRRSAQSSGEWPERAGRLLAIPAAAGAFAVVVLVLTALTAPTNVPQTTTPLTGGPPLKVKVPGMSAPSPAAPAPAAPAAPASAAPAASPSPAQPASSPIPSPSAS
jgi:cellulose synthase/poly-beta-1,6-N-acetylglucosamine synthase-like glycosyltransferase